MSEGQLNLLIGGGQLLLGLLVFVGIDFNWVRRKFGWATSSSTGVPSMSWRDKLVVVLLVGGLSFSAIGFYRTLDEAPEGITPETAKLVVLEWLTDPGLNISLQQKDLPEALWAIEIRVNNRRITLQQLQKRPDQLWLGADFVTTPKVRAILAQTSPDVVDLIRSLHWHLSELDIEYNLGPPFRSVLVQTNLPITNDLSKVELVKGIRRVDYGLAGVMQVATQLELTQTTQVK
jgi:hypothetical protein